MEMKKGSTWSRIILSSLGCSASIISFTIPQIVRLSKSSSTPLKPFSFSKKVHLMSRNLGPQTAITALQFGLVRKLRDVLDQTVGPSRFNISLAYGVASVPLIAAKYNLIQESVFYHGTIGSNNSRTGTVGTTTTTITETRKPWIISDKLVQFWSQKIQPGLLFSYLRDSGSIGGGIVLGPYITSKVMNNITNTEEIGPIHRFVGGLIAGCFTGLATQLFHNTALTAGRIAQVEKRTPNTIECLQNVIKEHGFAALYVNFRMRVLIIATWTAILNVTEPFAA